MRTQTIHVRVTPKLRAAIRRAARADGRTLSDWCARQLEQLLAPANQDPDKDATE